jgi:hypothetical protein
MRRRLSRRRFCVSVSWQLRAAASSEPWLRRLPVRNQADAVKTGVPHALDNLLDRVRQQVTPISGELECRSIFSSAARTSGLCYIICRGDDAAFFVRTRGLRISVLSKKDAADARAVSDGSVH